MGVCGAIGFLGTICSCYLKGDALVPVCYMFLYFQRNSFESSHADNPTPGAQTNDCRCRNLTYLLLAKDLFLTAAWRLWPHGQYYDLS